MKFYFLFMTLCYSSSLLAQSVNGGTSALNGKIHDQRDDVIFTYLRFGEKLYCVPRENLKLESIGGVREMEISNTSTPTVKSSLICYQCCVGENPHTKESCKKDGYFNYGKGRSCDCK